MPQRWSTMDVPKTAQFARWRELICEAFLALTPESDLRDGFAGTVAQRQLAELSIARITSQRQHVRRTTRDIDRSAYQGYYVNLQIRGSSLMTQDGRSTVLHPGDLAVVDTTRPFAFDFQDDFQQLSLYAPKALLLPGSGTPVTTATRVATAAGPGAAVRHALLSLTSGDLSEDTAARLAAHACGILSIALDQQTEPDPRSTPLRQDRLHAAALADIDEHLTDADLSAAAVAARLGVSVRLLYSVFAGRRHSFASEVRRRRLDHTWRDLRDPARTHLCVIDIAVAAGFADVTSFHRAFRREYGRTPAQVRRAALGGVADDGDGEGALRSPALTNMA
ncbi:transcriptional regulator, AraC family [Catenulispora acidiphila DSM 44928]|uniref:Transcriptional regulator, AraC family n=1 Tax=Catenulispora acidiphila (strain DSM 44928 / JCM 14897 / NBRC 102108 / NRRL B-24433 / ID139908) TaxID=479433 RepID=C7Q9A2_CATAD|nr:helix-turn-helix domain-containing protein [Catenulispora acidiphila]ACU74248.1 transcriptional regulator, AraC family [Catenulispora acidiphila DSM 44928]